MRGSTIIVVMGYHACLRPCNLGLGNSLGSTHVGLESVTRAYLSVSGLCIYVSIVFFEAVCLRGCFCVWSNHNKYDVWLYQKRYLILVRSIPIHVLNAKLAKQLLAAFSNFMFACTVQFTCTVHANNASELHCSREQCNSLAMFEWTFSFLFLFFF